METCKSKTIDLLKEIKNACESAGIRYYISGELALYEEKQEECREEFNNGTVAIFAEDVLRLVDILQKNDNRKLESLQNNSKFPGFYIRYMDVCTTLVNFTENVFTYNTNSIGVDIEIICGRMRNSFKRKVLSKLKRLWAVYNLPFYLRKRNSKYTYKHRLVALAFGILKRTPAMRILFNMWLNEGTKKTRECEIATNRGDVVKCSMELFDHTAKTEFLGEEFDIVENLEEYNERYFKKSLKKKPMRYDICAFNVPWAQFSKVIQDNNIKMSKYQKDEQAYLRWRVDSYIPMQNKRQKYYHYMFCAEDRMLMYKAFDAEKKARVMELYQQRDYENLAEILEEYISRIRHYARYRIGFCSDAEIFRAALSVMLYEAFNSSKKLSKFDRKGRRIISIVKETDYRHFDSVENVFWGEREDEAVLMERKEQILESVRHEVRGYFKEYRREKEK